VEGRGIEPLLVHPMCATDQHLHRSDGRPSAFQKERVSVHSAIQQFTKDHSRHSL